MADVAAELGIAVPPIIGEPGRQATVALPPHRDRVIAALNKVRPDWHEAGLLW